MKNGLLDRLDAVFDKHKVQGWYNTCIRNFGRSSELGGDSIFFRLSPPVTEISPFMLFLFKVSRVWQALVQDDDVRVPHGKAHENARSIVEDHDGLSKVTTAMKGKNINAL